MGNQPSQGNWQKFNPGEWERQEQLPDFTIWQSRRQPFHSLEEHTIYTNSSSDLTKERQTFELRRRSQFLVAALFLSSQPQEEFCSTHSRHAIFLERTPIRLADIEHLPYPDCLHLYDHALKGFAQLARVAGCFPVEDTMIGINERSTAKVWLNEDFSRSSPKGRITEQNMVRSLIEAIEKSIDSEELPPNVPTVRNFLYRNTDALTFDTAIWELGEFIRRFNSGLVPIKLDCVDAVGGVYAIANRDPSRLGRSNVSNRKINASSQMKIPENNRQKVSNQSQREQHKQSQQKFRVPLQNNITIERQSIGSITKRNPILQNFTFRNQAEQVRNIPNPPSLINQISFGNNPIPGQYTSRSIPNSQPQPLRLQTQSIQPPQSLHLQQIQSIQPQPQSLQPQPRSFQIQQQPNQLITLNSSIKSIPQAQRIYNPLPSPQSKRILNSLQMDGPSLSISRRDISEENSFAPRTSNAPKFTVEVIPGKVIPQLKSSTIFVSSKSGSSEKQIKVQQVVPLTSMKLVQNGQPAFTDQIKEVPGEHDKSPQKQVMRTLINSESGNVNSYTASQSIVSPKLDGKVSNPNNNEIDSISLASLAQQNLNSNQQEKVSDVIHYQAEEGALKRDKKVFETTAQAEVKPISSNPNLTNLKDTRQVQQDIFETQNQQHYYQEHPEYVEGNQRQISTGITFSPINDSSAPVNLQVNFNQFRSNNYQTYQPTEGISKGQVTYSGLNKKIQQYGYDQDNYNYRQTQDKGGVYSNYQGQFNYQKYDPRDYKNRQTLEEDKNGAYSYSQNYSSSYNQYSTFTHSGNLTTDNKEDGKTSPQFLRKLNQLTEKPKIILGNDLETPSTNYSSYLNTLVTRTVQTPNPNFNLDYLPQKLQWGNLPSSHLQSDPNSGQYYNDDLM